MNVLNDESHDGVNRMIESLTEEIHSPADSLVLNKRNKTLLVKSVIMIVIIYKFS